MQCHSKHAGLNKNCTVYVVYVHDVIRDVERKKERKNERKTPEAMEK